jgi:hypothetical protein
MDNVSEKIKIGKNRKRRKNRRFLEQNKRNEKEEECYKHKRRKSNQHQISTLSLLVSCLPNKASAFFGSRINACVLTPRSSNLATTICPDATL